MRAKWLNKKNNENLIVFFNGWGMDEKIVSNLMCDNWDVLVLFDYRDFQIEVFDFSMYENKTLIAWSLGVFVCTNYYELFKDFDKFIAINGTPKPIDDNFGIPSKIYNLTVDNFNEMSCAKFMKKISSNINIQNYCSRSCEELKNELISIKNQFYITSQQASSDIESNFGEYNPVSPALFAASSPPKNWGSPFQGVAQKFRSSTLSQNFFGQYKFNKVFVSLNDKIIPSKNQINYWNTKADEIIQLDMPHYIFDSFSKWSNFL